MKLVRDRQDVRGEKTPTISLSLRPVLSADGVEISRVRVAMTFQGLDFAPGGVLFQMPVLFDNFETTAQSIVDLEVMDGEGPVGLNFRDIESTGGTDRVWNADRSLSGELSVRYSISANSSSHTLGGAPPLEIRSEGAAFSGGGVSLLVLPPSLQLFDVEVEWDLSDLPRDAKGVSTFGQGDARSEGRVSLSQLKETYFMAGMIGYYSEKPAFFACWQGTPPYDARTLMLWAGRLYDGFNQFFNVREVPRYGVFLRKNPVNAGGGREGYRSFVVTYGHGLGNDPRHMRFVLSHEMFHTFSPMLNRPKSAAEKFQITDYWFSEGLAVYYAGLLPLRLGLVSEQEYISDLNFYVGRYYTSVMMSVPNEELPARYWSDTRIRTLAYDRSMLYFTTVDFDVRRATDKRFTLDDLVRELRAREDSGRTINNGDWEELLQYYVGPPSVDQFHEFLAGKPPLPASEAFGSQFRRTTKPMRRYELGFDPQVLADRHRVVRGLVDGSEAQRAGLRNGDRIVAPIPQDLVQGIQDMKILLRVERGRHEIVIEYLPRGEVVDTYQWELIV